MLNSYGWIYLIFDNLFKPEKRRLSKLIDELRQKNQEIKAMGVTYGFVLMGRRYIPEAYLDVSKLVDRKLFPALAFELQKEGTDLIEQMDKLEFDQAQIKQSLYKLIGPSTDMQQVRDALPECLVQFAPEVSKLNRRVNSPFDMPWIDERTARQYKAVLPKIEFYAMSHLLY